MISQSFQKRPGLCRPLEIGVIIAPSPQYFPVLVIQSIIASVLHPPCPHSHPYTPRRSKWKAQFSFLYRPWHKNALGTLLSDLESQERLMSDVLPALRAQVLYPNRTTQCRM